MKIKIPNKCSCPASSFRRGFTVPLNLRNVSCRRRSWEKRRNIPGAHT